MQGMCMAFILLAACWYDIRYSKIPNKLILIGWAIGLALAGWRQGLKVLPYSMADILIVIAVGFPLYWCRAVGAGDVKLLSVLAGIHGVKQSALVFAAGIPLAAVTGVFVLAGSAFGVGRWIPDCWKRRLRGGKLCDRKEDGGEKKGRRLGRHRLILAPFLTLAYWLLYLYGKGG